MTLRLYDSASRQVRDFQPLVEGQVGIYLCGATVQSPPHIGHMRSGLVFDVLRRWFAYRGYAVTFVRNVTDIDDKILRGAAAEGVPWWALGARNKRAFDEAYASLGCLPPTLEPLATGHVPEMVTLMRRLIEAGHAYPAGGDVYFDVRSFPNYGALSNQRVDAMQPAEDSDDTVVKRDPHDFALWKGAKPGEPTWETPWGEGRPGWHLECSAMATKYLGPVFDIHAGGIELIFPHHENEVAQSTAAGDGFARYWLHNGLLNLAGEKMSKSLGNILSLAQVARQVRPVELRYYLVSAHYRSTLDYSEQSLEEAAAAYRRVEGFVRRAAEVVGAGAPGEVPAAYAEALDDDLGVPAGLSVLHGSVRDGNVALTDGDREALAARLAEVRAMLGTLGVDPLAEPWVSGGVSAEADKALGTLVRLVLDLREEARARKDFRTADSIRATLADAGIVVEDAPSGPRWSLASGG